MSQQYKFCTMSDLAHYYSLKAEDKLQVRLIANDIKAEFNPHKRLTSLTHEERKFLERVATMWLRVGGSPAMRPPKRLRF